MMGRATTLTFRMTVSSRGTELTTLPGGHVYGSNRLVGTTTWAGRKARAVFLALVDYTDGSGPFTGQLTITRSDGTRLGLSVDGASVAVPRGTTRFSGSVAVIGGSGGYAGATGAGTLTGARQAALGGAVALTVTVTVLR